MITINSGALKGIRIKHRPNPNLRPTAGKVRCAIIDRYRSSFFDKKVLDLCCGTGAVGLEILSNGAAHVTFVDRHRSSIQSLRNFFKRRQLINQACAFDSDCLSFIEKSYRKKKFYDFIFADPPYQKGYWGGLVDVLSKFPVLNHEGVFVYESSTKEELLPMPAWCKFIHEAKYGDIKVSSFKISAHHL